MKRSDRPLVGVTMGDPAGIGAEITVKAAEEGFEFVDIVVIGDADVLEAAADHCDSHLTVCTVESVDAVGNRDDELPVIDLENVGEVTYGEISEANGRASLEYIEHVIDLARSGAIDAIATAPINKQATARAGSEYTGHTDMLADYTDTDTYAMMLIENQLRVTHVSTHVSLYDACDLVTSENVFETITVTEEGLEDLGLSDPTIAVAGLNPHAGEGGLLGDEDGTVIEPAVNRARETGVDVVGPESPDTVFVQAASGDFDCVVSMYHDQGHIPIKMLGFENTGVVSGINMTVGLPVVRTSVDHGTAFDIAGQGIASEASMVDAIQIAGRVAKNRA